MRTPLFFRRPMASIAVVLVATLALSGCVPGGSDGQTEIAANAEGIDVTVAAPPAAADNEEVAVAFTASGAVLPSDYLMLHPMEISSDGEIPASGVELSVTLSTELPEGATGTFAYFDEELQVWTPVTTEVDGTDATATVDHLSLWTFIITGSSEIIDVAVDGIEAAGEAVTAAAGAYADAFADGAVALSGDVQKALIAWQTEGPGSWLYRQAGLLLGIAAEQPECETGDLPGWVEDVAYSTNLGLAEENQSVLWCVGPLEGDANRVEVKAAVNRAYGFPVELAEGLMVEVEWSHLADLTALDVSAVAQFLSDGQEDLAFLDPREFVVGTSSMTFSVSEDDIRSIPEGDHLFDFTKPDELQVAQSVALKMLFDAIEDETSGLVAATLAMRSCRFDDFPSDGEPASWAGWLVGCIGEVTDEDFQKDLVAAIDKAKASDVPLTPALERLWSDDGKKVARKALHAFKWIDVLTLALPMIDYAGERVESRYVDIIPTEKPKSPWDDIDGTWCSTTDASSCMTIADGRDVTYGSTLTFTEDRFGCSLGLSEGIEGGGANLLYCPAGVATPGGEQTDSLLRDPYGDNARFDRIWFYNGVGPETMFRQSEVAAAKG